jgi:hypothetical protein
MKDELILGEYVPNELICKNRKWTHIAGVNEGDCRECDRYVENFNE